ncbi:MAG: carbohydrate ABC transporter permease [Chloroflexi bacterium]|nr:MAG: carbohydrate ABC transporter permease [Chloroflexota bacterium]
MNNQTKSSLIWPARIFVSTNLIYIFCIILALGFLFPIVWSGLNSIKPPAEAAAVPPTYLPSHFSFENYTKLNDIGVGLPKYFSNSVIVAAITVAGTILLSGLGGYGFARFSFRGKNVLFVIILSALMIPFQSILTPLFLIMGFLKLQNTLFGLALVYITFQLPFGLFLMRNSFESIPRELEEAALLDGCSSFSMLYRVMLPLVMPGIITVTIYTFINSWNEFLAALIFMTQEDNFTLPILLSNVQAGFFGIDWGALQAGVMVAIIPCVVLFLLLQRYYLEGLTSGAVKG